MNLMRLYMRKEDKIEKLLVSILETIADATESVEVESADCGVLHFPMLKYAPVFEFTDEDIQLIKELGEDNLEDFSILID